MDRTDELLSIRTRLKKKLDKRRYEHTLGVSFTAAALAMSCGADIYKAQLAGLLHDCAKSESAETLIRRCRQHHVALSDEDLKSPATVHAKYGRWLSENRYGVHDEDILNAVSYHTTGRARMSQLEKIVFTADYIEPMRSHSASLPRLRALAFSDLDRCVYLILAETIGYLEKKGVHIHADTLKARDYFLPYEVSRENGSSKDA